MWARSEAGDYVHSSGLARLVRERQGHASRKHPKPAWWGFVWTIDGKEYVSAYTLKRAQFLAAQIMRKDNP